VQQHFLHQHFACIFHAQCYHCQTVADQYHVHARMVRDVRTGEVMRRYHSYGFVLAVEVLEGVDSDRFTRIGR
jgi:hypothetical protein